MLYICAINNNLNLSSPKLRITESNLRDSFQANKKIMRRSLILDPNMERPSSSAKRTSSVRSQVSESEEPEAIADGASDVVAVEQADGTLRSTGFHVQGPSLT